VNLVFSRGIVGVLDLVLRSLIDARPQEHLPMDFLNKAEKLAKLSGRLHGSGNHDGSSEGGGGGAGNVIHSMFSHTTTTSHEGGPKRSTSVSEIYKDAQVLSAALNILRGQAFLSFCCT
jgi:hypothetical protein